MSRSFAPGPVFGPYYGMTQERFLKLLENPDLLASISYEELKTLALVYPYSHNLRYLLAIKSRQDNHPDFARNLIAAAAYSLDRTRLFRLIAPKRLVPMAAEAEEVVLELKPIQEVKQELQALAPVPRAQETATAASSMTAQANPAGDISVPPLKEDAGPIETPEPAFSPTSAENAAKTREKGEKLAPLSDFQPSFSLWASQFNAPVLSSTSVERKTPSRKPERQIEPEANDQAGPAKPAVDQPHREEPPVTPQTLAEKSITENKDIVSETLARLYAQQGYRDKAIAMYERLSLAFPDKSAYFAAEIEKLKK